MSGAATESQSLLIQRENNHTSASQNFAGQTGFDSHKFNPVSATRTPWHHRKSVSIFDYFDVTYMTHFLHSDFLCIHDRKFPFLIILMSHIWHTFCIQTFCAFTIGRVFPFLIILMSRIRHPACIQTFCAFSCRANVSKWTLLARYTSFWDTSLKDSECAVETLWQEKG